jgi:hypothetical protein
MRKTRIVKIIKELNTYEYNVTIIIPLIPISISSFTVKELKKILNELLSKPKNILKKKESKIFDGITSSSKDVNVEIKRNFNILVNDYIIKISESHLVLDDEKINIENYLKDYSLKYKNFKYAKNISSLFFEYNFLLRDK